MSRNNNKKDSQNKPTPANEPGFEAKVKSDKDYQVWNQDKQCYETLHAGTALQVNSQKSLDRWLNRGFKIVGPIPKPAENVGGGDASGAGDSAGASGQEGDQSGSNSGEGQDQTGAPQE